MTTLASTLVFLSLIARSRAGVLGVDEPCAVSNNRLQVGTYQYWDECNSVNYCSPQLERCVPKTCRKAEYPFGFTPGMTFPDKCPFGQFCTDEGSACVDLLPLGADCQFNRDDQCAPPENWRDLADVSGRGTNYNGSVCLNNKCMFADVEEGGECEVENTPYIAYGLEGEYINVVSRGNCRIGNYCDGPTLRCLKNKEEGDACDADKECDSMNCLSSGKCGVPAATPHKFGIWAYVLVAIGIIGGMSAILVALFFAHRKQRDQEREKRLQYWREQNAFHQNLMQMREAARASILALPQHTDDSPRSSVFARDYSDESSAPMMQHTSPNKGSNLRNYVGDDSYDNLPSKRAGNPF